jgi:hypothetical protein
LWRRPRPKLGCGAKERKNCLISDFRQKNVMAVSFSDITCKLVSNKVLLTTSDPNNQNQAIKI